MTLKKIGALLLLLVFAAAGAAGAQDTDRLLDQRTANLWFEGEALGDLIIGARAQFAFIYVDGKLVESAWSDPMAPEWLKNNTSFYGGKETRKKAMFIIRVRTVKNLTLDHSMISIGSHVLTPADVLTNRHFVPVGELPPDLTAEFAVAVPAAAVKGKTVRFAVGDYATELELPKR